MIEWENGIFHKVVVREICSVYPWFSQARKLSFPYRNGGSGIGITHNDHVNNNEFGYPATRYDTKQREVD